VLAWLLGEPGSAAVRETLAGAELVLSSTLTLVECDRVLIRAGMVEGLEEAVAAERRARLRRAVEHWILFELDPEIVDRARRPFPKEPVRTLDALHLASAVLGQSLVPDLALLSLDDRVRGAAALMGFRLLPR
jgi:predicted nucleic acid-binding protein